MNTLDNVNVSGKRVFYRPDYNVPLKDGVIQDDYRFMATLPTLDTLLDGGAKLIIGFHIGRPEGKKVAELETRPIAERIADQYPNRVVHLAHELFDPEVEKTIAAMQNGDILVLPNLRFWPEEDKNDVGFARKLADMAEIYVNDAFACDHREAASIVGIPKLLPSYTGKLLCDELTNLGGLVQKPEHPFVVVMGGAKVSDKIEVIKQLAVDADHILIGGAMANTFLLAKGEKIGDSLAEKDKVDLAEKLMKDLGDKLVLAEDFVKDEEKEEGFKYLDIGPKSVETFKTHLKEAKLIFWNGSLGYIEDPKFAKATNEIAQFIGNLKDVQSIIAGGDTVETITKLGMHDKFTFVSTGGGAALEYLAGEELPGVMALEEASQRDGGEAEEEKAEKVEEKAEEVKEEIKEEAEPEKESAIEEVKGEAKPEEGKEEVAAESEVEREKVEEKPSEDSKDESKPEEKEK